MTSMKKKLCVLLTCVNMFSVLAMGIASAEGNIWMNENTDIPASRYKKVAVYPICYPGETDGDYMHDPEYNDLLLKRLNKREKGINWMGFSPMIEEKEHILRDNPEYDRLLTHFPTEKDRAKAVYDAAAADGYLLPRVQLDKVRIDHSPEVWTTVKMESYYDIRNGRNGDEDMVHYHSWYEPYVISAHDSELRMLDVDFTMIDCRTGEPSLTLVDYYRVYDCDKSHAFKQIFKNFAGDFSRQKNDKVQEVPAGAPELGFKNLELPVDASNNELSVKTIYYAYKDTAGDRLKKVKAVYEPRDTRYYVTGSIKAYDMGETWNPPHVTTDTVLDHTDKYDWYDSDGKKHTAEKKYYRTQVTEHYGCYSFWYHVAADLKVVDSLTGRTVLENYYEYTDPDRFGNALRGVFNAFYDDVDGTLGKSV